MPSYFMGGQSRSVLLIKELSFFLFGSFFTADKNVIFRFYTKVCLQHWSITVPKNLKARAETYQFFRFDFIRAAIFHLSVTHTHTHCLVLLMGGFSLNDRWLLLKSLLNLELCCTNRLQRAWWTHTRTHTLRFLKGLFFMKGLPDSLFDARINLSPQRPVWTCLICPPEPLCPRTHLHCPLPLFFPRYIDVLVCVFRANI